MNLIARQKAQPEAEIHACLTKLMSLPRIPNLKHVADRITLWGGRDAFWGLWVRFFSGVFIVVVLGFLACMAISALEGALIWAGLALAAALYSLSIPRNGVIAFEAEVMADSFLVMVYGA